MLPSETALGQVIEKFGQIEASIRSKVEYSFHLVKNLFRHKNGPLQAAD